MSNFLERPVDAKVTLVLPEGWEAAPAQDTLRLPACQRETASFRAGVPLDCVFDYPRVAIAADIVFDGCRLGQITEATVEAV